MIIKQKGSNSINAGIIHSINVHEKQLYSAIYSSYRLLSLDGLNTIKHHEPFKRHNMIDITGLHRETVK